MKSLKNHTLNLFHNEGYLFENRIVWLSAEATKPADPFAEGIEEPEKGPKATPEKKDKAKEKVGEIVRGKIDQVEGQKEREQKEAVMNSLIKLTKGEKPDPAHMSKLKDFMLNLKNDTPVEIQKLQPVNDSLVKCVIARSKDSQYFKISLYAFNDSKGYPPNVFGRAKTEHTMYFNTKGEAVPADKIEKEIKPAPEFKNDEINKIKYNEVFRDDAEGKFRNSITKIANGDTGEFLANKENIKQQILSLKLEEGKTVNLGGISILSRKPENSNIPNIIVFKNGKAVCYMLNNELKIATKEKGSYTERCTETLAANRTLDQVIKGLKFSREKKQYIISPNDFNNMRQAFINLARFASDEFQRDFKNPYKPTVNYNLAESRVNVSYWRQGQFDGFFSININGKVFGFTTTQPDTLYTKDTSKPWKWDANYPNSFILNADERDAERKQDATAREKSEKDRAEKVRQTELKRETEAEKVVRDEVSKEDKEAFKNKIFNANYIKHLKFSADENKFKIDFQGANSIEKSRLENKTKIQDLFNLSGLNQIITVNILNKKGSTTMGMYYPGQDTVFEIKEGKQTKNRMKIFNGDEIQFNIGDATQKFRDMRNDQGRQESVDFINSERFLQERKNLLSDFKGKYEDLNPKLLNDIKLKFKNYDPKSILDKNRSLSGIITSFTDQTAIYKMENVILKEGIIKLRTKVKVEEMKKGKPLAKPSETMSEAQFKILITERNKLAKTLREKMVTDKDITYKEHADLEQAYKDCGLKLKYNPLWIFGEVKNPNPNIKFLPIHKKEMEILKRIKFEKKIT